VGIVPVSMTPKEIIKMIPNSLKLGTSNLPKNIQAIIVRKKWP